jgi:hypothetical protein
VITGTSALDPDSLAGNEHVLVCRSADGLSRDQWTVGGSGELICDLVAYSETVSGLAMEASPLGFTVTPSGAMEVALAVGGVFLAAFAARSIIRTL